MKLERSIDSLAKKLDKLDSKFSSSNRTGLNHWKDKPIIPLEEWIKFRDTPYALHCFPDDFDQMLTYLSKEDLKKGRERKDIEKWNSDYLGLMEHTKNPNFGKLKCFHCLLSPAGDDPIFIGINRLVAKGLNNDFQGRVEMEYPCQVVNRFQCPYERTNAKKENEVEFTNFPIDVEDLFKLQKMAFIVEIALAKARKDDSEILIKEKQDLLNVLTDRDAFIKLLQQADDTLMGIDNLDVSSVPDDDYIVDYFTRIKDKIDLEELRFY